MNTPLRATVFLGPSLPVDLAHGILDADYRPPVRRGDLDTFVPGDVVGIIDGVFEQNLAVSPEEVYQALNRGIVLFGGSSMGALRASEVPGVIGVGRVFEWYRDGHVTRDDEVALLFDPMRHQAMTVPTVSVRFAVDRLLSLGTLDATTAAALIAAAESLNFRDRTYRRILRAAGLDQRADADDLIAMLASYDIKATDAHAVLEAIDRHLQSGAASRNTGTRPEQASKAPAPKPSEGLLIWESGDAPTMEMLHRFLAFTGDLPYLPGIEVSVDAAGMSPAAQNRFLDTARRWGWMSGDEASVTLADLHLESDLMGAACAGAELEAEQRRAAFRAATEPEMAAALRAALVVDNMGLKRALMRCAALPWLAARIDMPPDGVDLAEARQAIVRRHAVAHFHEVEAIWRQTGLSDQDSKELLQTLAQARRYARRAIAAMRGSEQSRSIPPETLADELPPSPKPDGEIRFANTVGEAVSVARRVSDRIGITRIGMIGELGDLGKIQVAQAARPGNAWSSSYGSGKSCSRDGAIVGAVMEECEKWAQERFDPAPVLTGSYAALSLFHPLVDPATIDLPYDSVYHADLELDWIEATDLSSGQPRFLPRDLLVLARVPHDICYSARGARKHLATNGLGAGLSRAEALLHGLCEFVERHAQRMAELYLSNPGGLGIQPFRFVDARAAAPHLQHIIDGLIERVDTIRVLDITSEIAIPTYMAAIVRKGQVAHGFGAHPNPIAALEAALLEAAQTIASSVAGGREDLSIHARSLGRHERPRPADAATAWFWIDPDSPEWPLRPDTGFASTDVRDDLAWCLEAARRADIQEVLAADLSHPEIAPVQVVRVIVPGLESNNPFYTGPRARLALLRDLLPRWV